VTWLNALPSLPLLVVGALMMSVHRGAQGQGGSGAFRSLLIGNIDQRLSNQ
jgi:hypothetical protein